MSEEFDSINENEGVADIGNDGTQKSTVMMSLAGYTFDTLVGFGEEVERLRLMGLFDDSEDSEFVSFVEQMKLQHGLFDEPTGEAILFKSFVREDADRLMIATANELGHPTVRMRVASPQPGVQAICIMATPGVTEKGFEDWGTLVLEGVDTWGAPEAMDLGVAYDEMAVANAASGAMKAVSLIRNAAANPKVTILASASGDIDSHSLIAAWIGPMKVFDVPAPSQAERDEIWNHLMSKHVSMSAMDCFELVRLSEGMPRCDIFAAAREAVSQAYRQSIGRRTYVPVDRGNLLNKIAAYQPLDSKEYRWIEDSAVDDFRDEIERYERGEI